MTNEKMYARKSKPFGKSWEEWASLWWQWCSAEPDDTNPAADSTGKNCGRNQKDPNVWFLAGTFGGSAIRYCLIPKDKSLLFPIVTNRISFAEHNYLKSEEELYMYAKADLDHATICVAYVDGIELPELQNYRIRTGLFSFTIPTAEAEKIPVEACQAISDGYWVFLRPLPLGQHTINFVGEKLKYDEIYVSNFKGIKPKFRVEVKYFLTVE